MDHLFLLNLVLFFILVKIQGKRKFKGQVLLGYLIGYSMFRMILESFRLDSLMIFNFRISQILSIIIFIITIMIYFVLNRKNIILMLISIEIMLLSITLLILISSLSFDDILGQTFAIYIITIAGAESAIGLGILVAFYRLRGSISIQYR